MICNLIWLPDDDGLVRIDRFEIPGLGSGDHHVINFGVADWTVLSVGTALKLVLYLYCVRLKDKSDSMGALAEDHVNDVFRCVPLQIGPRPGQIPICFVGVFTEADPEPRAPVSQ